LLSTDNGHNSISTEHEQAKDGFNTSRMSSTVLDQVNQLALILLRKT
jgi:hypothetical protein